MSHLRKGGTFSNVRNRTILQLRGYREAGLAGIEERSRVRGARWRNWSSTWLALRRRYPDWAARKLQVLLAREQVELTHSTIHRILLLHDLVRDPPVTRQRQSLQFRFWALLFLSTRFPQQC